MRIGFDQEAMRNRLREEGFESITTSMKEKDMCDLAESYRRRTVADGRSIFGLRRIRYLIGLIHWVQDFARVGEEPTLAGLNNMASFQEALDTAFYRAGDVRKWKRIRPTLSVRQRIRENSRTRRSGPNGNQPSSIICPRFLEIAKYPCRTLFVKRITQFQQNCRRLCPTDWTDLPSRCSQGSSIDKELLADRDSRAVDQAHHSSPEWKTRHAGPQKPLQW
jgi:hypothetical protein